MLRTIYPLAVSSWDEEEAKVIEEVVHSGRLTMGARVRRFEEEFARTVGSRYAVMVNSGSSANLLGVAALTQRGEAPLRRDDEVIVPAVGWSTSYYPWVQCGMKLRFVDVEKGTLNIDPLRVDQAITPATRAVCAVNILGMPCNFEALREVCEHHDLLLFEDNCESMGARLLGKACGTFGACGTFSTFFSHHICTMEGGLVVTDDRELYEIMLSMRAHGWTRDLPDEGDDPFFDSYRFVLPGYNLRPTEVSGALGSCQLEKLPALLEGRCRNADYFRQVIGPVDGIRLQSVYGESSWFGFSMILSGAWKGRRGLLVDAMREAGIDCRPIVAGNFVRQPVASKLPHSVSGHLPVADEVHDEGLFVGNHHVDLREGIDALYQVISGIA